jgi:hypothetical protein
MSLHVFPVHAAEVTPPGWPTLTETLSTLGFTNVTESTIQTFPPGRYNLTLYAEFAAYFLYNVDELSIYEVGKSNFTTILEGSEGSFGYVSPPVNTTFQADYQFGLSFSRNESYFYPFRYFTESALNPDGTREALVFNNLNVPGMYLIFFQDPEDSLLNYNDIVFSIQLENYLQVVSPYDTPSGGGWYYNGTTAFASLTNGNFSFNNGTRRFFVQWGGDASGTNYQQSNPILMDRNKTAIAQWQTQYYLTVGTVPSGLAVISGQDWYDENQKVTLTAPSVSGYSFTYWDVDGVPQTTGLNPLTVNMNGPHTATAHYARIFTLTIITTSGGSTTPSPGAYTFNEGSTVQVTAVANSSYLFDHWELDGAKVGSANPYTVLMNADHTLKATFVRSSPPQPVGGYSYSVQAVESPKPLTLYLPFVAVSVVVITAISRRRKRSKE